MRFSAHCVYVQHLRGLEEVGARAHGATGKPRRPVRSYLASLSVFSLPGLGRLAKSRRHTCPLSPTESQCRTVVGQGLAIDLPTLPETDSAAATWKRPLPSRSLSEAYIPGSTYPRPGFALVGCFWEVWFPRSSPVTFFFFCLIF